MQIRDSMFDHQKETFKINQKSKEIARKINLEPIHKRCNKILEQKERGNKELKDKINMIEKLKDLQEYDGEFKPKIDITQKKVQGKRNDPLMNKVANKEYLDKAVEQKIKKEMKLCTFKPKINKKSENIVKSAKKQKKQREEAIDNKPSVMFPMKPQINPCNTNELKSRLFFDFQNNRGNQEFNTHKEMYSSTRNNDLNTDIIYKTYTKMGTPEFCDDSNCQMFSQNMDIEDNNRSRMEYDIDEDEQIDMLLKQVAHMESNVYISEKSVRDKKSYASPTFAKKSIQ